MDPLNNNGSMPGGAFARNHGAHPKGGNQLRLLFWRVSHGRVEWGGRTCICKGERNDIRPSVPYATTLMQAAPARSALSLTTVRLGCQGQQVSGENAYQASAPLRVDVVCIQRNSTSTIRRRTKPETMPRELPMIRHWRNITMTLIVISFAPTT